MPDAATERQLGEISATVNGIKAAQVVAVEDFKAFLTDDFKAFCNEDRIFHAEMGKLQHKLAAEVASIHIEHRAHTAEDNRRFRLLWRMLFSGGALLAALVLIAREISGAL